MLYREIIALCSQIHTEHKYTVWVEGRNICVRKGGKYSYHYGLSIYFAGTHCMIAAGTLHTQYALPFNTTVAAHEQRTHILQLWELLNSIFPFNITCRRALGCSQGKAAGNMKLTPSLSPLCFTQPQFHILLLNAEQNQIYLTFWFSC